MSYKRKEKSVAFTIRLPKRCVEIIDELIEAGIYSSRGECIRDIIRSALREGFHKKMLPERDETEIFGRIAKKGPSIKKISGRNCKEELNLGN
jgi:Arc/MetJ-type ribon-helix-helix transcriptional regulator